MSKEALYWLGSGTLEGKDPKTKKKEKYKYGDIIPEDRVHPATLKKLMKDGAIGTKMTPIKATETARLQNKVKEQDTKIKALEAGDAGNVTELQDRVKTLEEENSALEKANAELQKDKEALEAKVAELEKAPAGGKDGKDKGGVGPK